MEWGSEIPNHIFPTIKIHKWGWIPFEVGVGWKIPEKDEEGNDKTVARMGFHSVKYLGIQIDSNAFYERLSQETLKLIKNMCRIVRTKKASADLKASAAYTRISNMATTRGSMGHRRLRDSESGTSLWKPCTVRFTNVSRTRLQRLSTSTQKKTALDWGCPVSVIDVKRRNGARSTDLSHLVETQR